MRLDSIKSHLASEIKKVENARSRVSHDAKIRPHGAKPDTSTISSDAQQLNEANADNNIVKTQLTVESDIRTDRIAEVRQKIQNGYYDTPEFIDKLADKLLNEFGLSGESDPQSML